MVLKKADVLDISSDFAAASEKITHSPKQSTQTTPRNLFEPEVVDASTAALGDVITALMKEGRSRDAASYRRKIV